MIKHIIMIKFKPDTSEAQLAAIETGLAGLPAAIDEIISFEFGRDVVRADRSFDFALVAVFADLAALERYQVHPQHQQVAALVRQAAAQVVAVDFHC
ncbi:MAG: Dabb family protein [Deltaproteobacteria bacterium]|nr:Dabb family protein [Deltaproteobacteria bacterium]